MINHRRASVVLIGQAKEEFEKLARVVADQKVRGNKNSEEMQLLDSIRQKIESIKTDPTYGDSISKNKVPKSLNVSNLFRVKLTNYWRMLYSLKGTKIEVVAFVLYVVDHKTYDKIFRYRKW